MGAIINLAEWKKKKEENKDSLIQAMKDSLDNEAVKRKYKLNVPPPPPTEEERLAKIRASINRVNNLMNELHDNTKDNKR